MTIVIPEGYAQVLHSMRWAGDPEPMAITYGVEVDSAAIVTDAPTLATQLGQAFKDNIQGQMNDDLQAIETVVRWQFGAPPAPLTIGIDTSTAFTGTSSSGTMIPQNSAFLIHKHALVGGRGGRGRMYFPGVDESDVDNLGNVGGAVITSWNADLATWRTDINAAALVGPFGMVILHSDPGAFAAALPYPIASLTLDPVIATQRRRLRR